MRSNTGNHLIRHRLSLWGFGVFDIRSRMFSGQLPFIRRRLVSIWTCKTCPQQEPGGWNRVLLQVQDLPARIADLKEVILGVLIRMVIPSYFRSAAVFRFGHFNVRLMVAALLGKPDSDHILLQQIERCRKKQYVLHQKSDVLRHRRKPSDRRRPTIRHKWNNGACGDKAEAGTERAENSYFLLPESGEQQRPKQPFLNAQKISGPSDAKYGVHPEDQRTMANVRNQRLRFIFEPFLIPKKQEDDHHRCSNQVIIQIVPQNSHSD